MLRWRSGATGAMSIGLLGLGVSGGVRVTGDGLVRGRAGSVGLGLGGDGLDLGDVGDNRRALPEKLALPLGERPSTLSRACRLVTTDQLVNRGLRRAEG